MLPSKVGSPTFLVQELASASMHLDPLHSMLFFFYLVNCGCSSFNILCNMSFSFKNTVEVSIFLLQVSISICSFWMAANIWKSDYHNYLWIFLSKLWTMIPNMNLGHLSTNDRTIAMPPSWSWMHITANGINEFLAPQIFSNYSNPAMICREELWQFPHGPNLCYLHL